MSYSSPFEMLVRTTSIAPVRTGIVELGSKLVKTTVEPSPSRRTMFRHSLTMKRLNDLSRLGRVLQHATVFLLF